MKETAIGTAANQMARAVTNNLSQLNNQELESLRSALNDFTGSDTSGIL
jgi:hypothetical protein